MTTDPFYKSHWRSIQPGRMAAYRKGFAWDAATEKLFEPARIAEGQTIADFGCGPGKVAVELARRVGPTGQVHVIDINANFLEMAQENADAAGVGERVTSWVNDGTRLPLTDASLDRISARNAIMYVDDPVGTLREFKRVLKPGGLAHAIDGDWFMMVAEPVAHDAWRRFVSAASYACKNSDMGRKLYGAFTKAGFADVRVSVVVHPDVDGRLLGMIRNMAKYAVESGTLPSSEADSVVTCMEQALAEGSYFAASPQFVVTGCRPQ